MFLLHDAAKASAKHFWKTLEKAAEQRLGL